MVERNGNCSEPQHAVEGEQLLTSPKYLNNSRVITESSGSDLGMVIVCDTKVPEVFETNLTYVLIHT